MKSGLRNMDVDEAGHASAAGSPLLYGRKLRVAGLDLRPADAVFLSSLLFFSVLTVVVSGGDWARILKNSAVGLVLVGAIRLDREVTSRALKFWIRMVAVQLMFAYVFPLVTPFQLIIAGGWNDAAILNLEQAVFGVQPTIWIQKFISPALTEWMMFSYVTYVPLYPILCAVLYFKRGEQAMENFIFALAAANIACDLCFILYPVAGPLYWMADQYTVPLKGPFFAAAGEFVRTQLQGIGASIPSPHCANATIMWITAFRFHRPTFYVISPLVLSIYISAFYGRYHYLSDVLLGILMGAAVLLVVPFLIKAWNEGAGRRRAVWDPDGIPPPSET